MIFVTPAPLGPGAPGAPPRGRGARGPMTREEAQRLREEELAGQAHGKDCFIIPQVPAASLHHKYAIGNI